MVEFRNKDAGRTVAHDILDIVKLLKEDVAELKKMLGDDVMEPVDRRLKRMEAEIHAIGNGTFGQRDGDGMEERV